jgi:hypothetical protein
MKKPVLLLLCILPAIASAQNEKSMVSSEENLRNISRSAGMVMTTNMDELYEGIKGTPYLFDTWKQGNIFLKDSSLIRDINIKYNIYTDDVLYLNSKSGDSLIIDRRLIDAFEIQGDSSVNLLLFRDISLKPGSKDKSTFTRVLYNGKTKLLIKYIKVFIMADYKGAYTAGRRYDEYTDNSQYYIMKDNKLNRIKLNKKAIIKVLADRENEIKSFIDKEGADLNNEYDVITLLEYYDSLPD